MDKNNRNIFEFTAELTKIRNRAVRNVQKKIEERVYQMYMQSGAEFTIN